MRTVFFETLARIERLLEKAERPRAFKDEKLAREMRTQLFKLEGWAKLHRHWTQKKEQKVFSHIRDQAKELEDSFGQLDVARAFSKDLERKGFPDLAAHFDVLAKKARRDLKHVLKDRSWFAEGHETRVQKMGRHLESVDWPSEEMQINYLERALQLEMDDVNAHFREEWKLNLLAPKYDRETVESSLHKFRRQLRWFAIYFQTGDGLFALAPLPKNLSLEKRKLIEAYKQNPFAKLPTHANTKVLLDRVSYYELTRLIDELGVVKDKAEGYFYLSDLLVDHGESHDKAHSRARAIYGDAPNETPLAAQKILAEYERFKPLAFLSENLNG